MAEKITATPYKSEQNVLAQEGKRSKPTERIAYQINVRTRLEKG